MNTPNGYICDLSYSPHNVAAIDGGGMVLGSGSPEGVVEASPVREYMDVLTGQLYIKESGDGSTGWILIG